MSAGQPDWNKLHAMGKLPKSARGNVPLLAQLDAAQVEIKRLQDGMCDECRAKLIVKKEEKAPDTGGTTQLKCPHCPAMVGGKSEQVAKMNLGRHKKSAHPEIVEGAK